MPPDWESYLKAGAQRVPSDWESYLKVCLCRDRGTVIDTSVGGQTVLLKRTYNKFPVNTASLLDSRFAKISSEGLMSP